MSVHTARSTISGKAEISAAQPPRPKVTIGLPVYNGARFLDRAIRSLRSQNYPSLEIVISDNGSTDSTPKICARHAAEDPRIRVIQQPVNLGAHANFKAVADEADGTYFMWAADDDVWLPHFVSRLVDELEAHPDAIAAMCATKRVHEDGRDFDEVRFTGALSVNDRPPRHVASVVLKPFKHNMFIYALYRTKYIRRAVASFPTALGGDRMFVFQFALAGPLRYVDEFHYLRTHRRGHEKAYVHASGVLSTKLHQVAAFTRMLLGSQIVPIRRKLLAPYFVGLYGIFVWRQELHRLKQMAMNASGGVLRSRTRVIAAAVVAGTGLAVLTFVLASLGLLPPGALLPAAGLSVAGGSAALAGAGFAVLQRYRLVMKTVLGLRDRVGAVESRLVTVGKTLGRSKVVDPHGIEALTEAMQERTAAIAAVNERMTAIEKEMKYLTDMSLSPPDDIEGFLTAPVGQYGANRKNTMRKEIHFARSMEASRIRELFLAEIFPQIDDVSVPVGVVNELSGHPNKVDTLYVCAIAKHLKAKRIFEFGTYQGRTTLRLAESTPETLVTTIDLPVDQNPRYGRFNGQFFKSRPERDRIEQLFENLYDFDPSTRKQMYDFVFVDADHSYGAVENDTRKAFELIRPGGVIMWHDYAPKSAELVEFIRDFTQTTPLFRIRRTCLLLHIDGVDPMTFKAAPMPESLEAEHLEVEPYRVGEIYHH